MSFFGGSSRKIAEKHDDVELDVPFEQEDPPLAYTIDDAVGLMRRVSFDADEALVLSVIRSTLESLDVHLDDVIGDGETRLREIEDRTAMLREEIASFEQEIVARQEQTRRLRADYAETTAVKGHLELAMRR